MSWYLSWHCLLIEKLVGGVLDRVLDFDTAETEHRLTGDHCVADGDRLITLQQFLAGLEQLIVLGHAILGARLVGRRLALELGAQCILVAGNSRSLLIGRLPFIERLIAL